MRYRMEMIDGEIAVRNVETDLVVGWVRPLCIPDVHDHDRGKLIGCSALNKDGGEIAWISSKTTRNPLKDALAEVACSATIWMRTPRQSGWPFWRCGERMIVAARR